VSARLTTLALLLTTALFSADAGENKQIWAESVRGKKAPDLVVETWISEKPETKGKFLLIDFWATWCGPCRGAIPKLNKLHEAFKDDLVVIGLSDEPVERIKGLTSPKIRYFNAVDTKARMKTKLQVRGIPHVILVDPNGIVRWEGFPMLKGHELTKDVVAKVIDTHRNTAVTVKTNVAVPKFKVSATASATVSPPPPPPPPAK
jgi:thiol-disulfide isomerase/thioredoxin